MFDPIFSHICRILEIQGPQNGQARQTFQAGPGDPRLVYGQYLETFKFRDQDQAGVRDPLSADPEFCQASESRELGQPGVGAEIVSQDQDFQTLQTGQMSQAVARSRRSSVIGVKLLKAVQATNGFQPGAVRGRNSGVASRDLVENPAEVSAADLADLVGREALA